MGEMHLTTDPEIVLKLLAPRFADAGAAELIAGAERASALGHPGIVAVKDAGLFGGDDWSGYLALQRLRGRNLRDALDGGPPPVDTALSYLCQIAGAVGAAHRAGLAHGALQPSHLFVTDDGRVVVFDFGACHAAAAYSMVDRGKSMRSGLVMPFEPAYLSPEICKDGFRPSQPSDIYSLGVVFYELLCGVPPFRRESLLDTLYAHLRETPPRLPEHLPAADLVHALLDKDPAKRPSCDELCVELDRICAISAR